VGRSEGFSTPETIGTCQQTAIQFLETAMKANRIALAGYSIGGASIGQAILNPDFSKNKAKFFVIRQVTFSRASDLAEQFSPSQLKWCAKSLVHWSKSELDNVESSKKLVDLHIPELIIQGEITNHEDKTDGVIPYKDSLMNALYKEGITEAEGKTFLMLPDVSHNDEEPITNATVEAIRKWDEEMTPYLLAE